VPRPDEEDDWTQEQGIEKYQHLSAVFKQQTVDLIAGVLAAEMGKVKAGNSSVPASVPL